MSRNNKEPGSVTAVAGEDDHGFGDDHQHISSLQSPQLRLTIRRNIDGRLLWFRVENADGYAVEARAKLGTSSATMDDALAVARALLGEVTH